MLNRLRQFFAEHQFGCFIVLCLLIAFVMTVVSLELYRHSGAIKLDMSRPGYEKVRKEVEKSRDDQPFANSGVLDKRAVKDFDDRIKKYQDELKKLGGYDAAQIEDSDLNLVDNNDSRGNTSGHDTSAQPR